MRISDWSSDVCSSDLARISSVAMPSTSSASHRALTLMTSVYSLSPAFREASPFTALAIMASPLQLHPAHRRTGERSEEHTSELQSLMRISYAAVRWNKKKDKNNTNNHEGNQSISMKAND